jgi:hypothetical protein
MAAASWQLSASGISENSQYHRQRSNAASASINNHGRSQRRSYQRIIEENVGGEVMMQSW